MLTDDTNEQTRRRYSGSTSPIAIYSTLVISGAGWVAMAWMWFYPQPFLLAFTVTLLLPILAVVLCATGEPAFDLGMRFPSNGGTVSYAFVLPSIALASYAFRHVRLLEWKEVLVIAVAGGVALGFLAFVFTPRSKRDLFGGAAAMLVMAAYSYGTVVIVDRHWDSGPELVTRVEVLRTRVTRGAGKNYRLLLSPGGPGARPREVEVDRDLYAQVSKGSILCVRQHDGALGIGWYVVARCDAS